MPKRIGSAKIKQYSLAFLLAGVIFSAHSQPLTCPVPGETIHWVADYCMLTLQTDDEIAASDCILRERRERPADSCAAKLAYKRLMCERLAATGQLATGIAACVQDPAMQGRTVRNGGVGG